MSLEGLFILKGSLSSSKIDEKRYTFRHMQVQFLNSVPGIALSLRVQGWVCTPSHWFHFTVVNGNYRGTRNLGRETAAIFIYFIYYNKVQNMVDSVCWERGSNQVKRDKGGINSN